MSLRKSIPMGTGASVIAGRYPTFADTDPSLVQGLNGRPDSPASIVGADASQFPARTQASGTVTIAGTPAEGDTVTVTLAGTAVTYTLLAGDDATDVAVALVALLRAAVGPTFVISNAAGVITVMHTGGQFGNSVTLTTAVTGTITATASGANLTGGDGPALITQNFPFWYRGQLLSFRAGHHILEDAGLLAAIYADPTARLYIG